MNKPVYLGLGILGISKIAMCKFQYDYMKSKYGERAKLCYMDTDSFIAHIKTENIKIFQNMSKEDTTLQIMKQIDSCLWEK